MVRQQTSAGLQIKFHFYGRSDWGRNRGYGEGAARDDGRWKNGDETFFYMVLLLWVLPKNMGGGHGPCGIMVMRFLPAAVRPESVGTPPVIHKLSVRHITDRLNSRPKFKANLSLAVK